MAEGQHSYLLYPRDTTSGAYVATVSCRCTVEIDPGGIRKLIKVEPTLVVGRKVTTKVVAQGAWVVEAERGDEYPGVVPAAMGTYFMKNAVQQTAGWLNRSAKAR